MPRAVRDRIVGTGPATTYVQFGSGATQPPTEQVQGQGSRDVKLTNAEVKSDSNNSANPPPHEPS